MSSSSRLLGLLFLAGCATLDEPAATVHWSLGPAHQELSCATCHEQGFDAAVDGACASCHEADRPVGHFAGACEACHPPTTWADGSVDHASFTRFPVPHRGVSACTDCHVNEDGYQSFSCIDCHTHSRANTDGHHREVGSRYRYESEACLGCHADGRGDD